MVVTNNTCEGIVPALAHVVGTFAAGEGGVVNVPHHTRKRKKGKEKRIETA